MENVDVITALDLAIRISNAEQACDRTLGITLGSTVVGFGHYAQLASDEKLPWVTHGWLTSIMGWTSFDTRAELLSKQLKHLGWPVVRVLTHGRTQLTGYVSLAATHEETAPKDTIFLNKVDFVRALELCKAIVLREILNKTEAVQFLLNQPKVETGIGFSSGGMVAWARVGEVHGNGKVWRTDQEAVAELPYVRMSVINDFAARAARD